MYYESGTDGRCCIWAGQTLRLHSTGGITFLPEMTSWPPSWKYDVVVEIRFRQSMRICFAKEQSCRISSRSDLKRQSLRLFWRGSSKRRPRTTTRWVAIYEISSWSLKISITEGLYCIRTYEQRSKKTTKIGFQSNNRRPLRSKLQNYYAHINAKTKKTFQKLQATVHLKNSRRIITERKSYNVGLSLSVCLLECAGSESLGNVLAIWKLTKWFLS